MRLDVDETYISMAATAAGLAGGALAVADCMANGMITTSQHLGVALAAFVIVRLTIGRALRPTPTPSPAPAPSPAAPAAAPPTAPDDTED